MHGPDEHRYSMSGSEEARDGIYLLIYSWATRVPFDFLLINWYERCFCSS